MGENKEKTRERFESEEGSHIRQCLALSWSDFEECRNVLDIFELSEEDLVVIGDC